MEVQNTQSKQQGFSLIELLVVVAIIGVLAAAGIVGYTSYLEGVKKDTNKNNAITLAKALNTTGVARSGGLTVEPVGCAGVAATALGCAQALITGGKFVSPWGTSVPYIADGAACNGSQKGALALEGADGSFTLHACDKDGLAYTPNAVSIAVKF